MKTLMFKFLLPLILGVAIGVLATHKVASVFLAIDLKDRVVEVPAVEPILKEAPTEANTVVSERHALPFSKVGVRKAVELRLYADDGTYMIATLDEYVASIEDEPISSSVWIEEK